MKDKTVRFVKMSENMSDKWVDYAVHSEHCTGGTCVLAEDKYGQGALP